MLRLTAMTDVCVVEVRFTPESAATRVREGWKQMEQIFNSLRSDSQTREEDYDSADVAADVAVSI